MAARQPSASLADRDASRSHGSMMTERDEGTDGPRLAYVWNISGPVSPGGSQPDNTDCSDLVIVPTWE